VIQEFSLGTMSHNHENIFIIQSLVPNNVDQLFFDKIKGS